MREILISNNVAWHYEIIESAIVKYDQLLNIEKDSEDIIYLWTQRDFNMYPPNINYNSFISYIENKYPNVFVLNGVIREFDYEIHCTVTGSNYNASYGGLREKDIIDDERHAYISHDYVEEFLDHKNVFFLNKFDDRVDEKRILTADILPYCEKKIKRSIPKIIIQGSLDMGIINKTKDYSILSSILNGSYEKPFEIHVIGRSSQKRTDVESALLSGIKNKENLGKVQLHINKTWKDYHIAITDAYAIIPTVSFNKKQEYFTTKITSSYNYGLAYNLKFFVEQKFAEVYDIMDKSYIYNEDNIVDIFNKLVNEYGENNG